MVRILGNSPERVPIPDLGDVIYYRQRKDYTDTEFENSKDLKKAIRLGKLTELEHFNTQRCDAEIARDETITIQSSAPAISLSDMKEAIREAQAEGGTNGTDIKKALQEAVPLIVDMVRQEVISAMSHMVPVAQAPVHVSSPSDFVGPEFISLSDTGDMKSNITAEEREVSGSDVDDAMAALRNLNKG